MKNITILFVLLFGLISIGTYAQRQDKHKIVFQFTNANDTIQQKAFTNQLNNLTTHWPKAKYEVVVLQYGIRVSNANKIKTYCSY
jgi:intracellular sulfur oxidation DsrE/DsrF family protein